MKKQKIGSVSPHFFEDVMIISFSKKWLNHFDVIPTFDVTIDQSDRVHLISPKIKRKD